jgi:hypothetical protein
MLTALSLTAPLVMMVHEHFVRQRCDMQCDDKLPQLPVNQKGRFGRGESWL